MAYFGKVFKVQKEEGFAEFLKTLNITDDAAANFEPSIKIEKDGDNYTLSKISPAGTRVKKFKSEVTFDDPTRENLVAKTTITVDGNTFTEFRDFGEHGSVTMKREFSDDKLVVTLTSTMWPGGVARRYYA